MQDPPAQTTQARLKYRTCITNTKYGHAQGENDSKTGVG